MMTTQEFIDKAMAQQQTLQHINISALTPDDMTLHLEGKCICCCGDTPIHPVEEAVDGDDHCYMMIIGYGVDLFCDGCVDHLDAGVLHRYGVISDDTYNKLCNPTDDTTDDDDDLPF